MDVENPKKERFKRLAGKRTNEVLKRLRILGNCADRSRYDYTGEDIEKIFRVINREVTKTKSLFSLEMEEEFKL